jgi:hypothetical protein
MLSRIGSESETAGLVRALGDALGGSDVVEATGTVTASATAAAVGAAFRTTVGSAAGVAVPTGVAAALWLGAGSSSGVAAGTGAASLLELTTGSAGGVAASTATSGAVAKTVASADGVAEVLGATENSGLSPVEAAAAGLGTAAGVGFAIAAAVGSAAGVGTGSGATRATTQGTAAGTSSVDGEAQVLNPEGGLAEGVATAQGVSGATKGSEGNGAGVATPAGVSSGADVVVVSAVGQSDGLAATVGVGRLFVPRVGQAAGAADVTGVCEDVALVEPARIVFIVPTVRRTFIVPLGRPTPLGTVPKKPGETFTIAADFSLHLGVGEVLASQIPPTSRNLSTGADSTDALLTEPLVTGVLAQVRLKDGGGDGERHRVQLRVITNFGNTYESEIDVRIRETRLVGRMVKQPSETLKIGADFTRRLAGGEAIFSKQFTAKNLADGSDSTEQLLLLQQAFVADGDLVQVRVKAAGLHGETHRVQLRLVTSLANTYEAEMDVLLREVL